MIDISILSPDDISRMSYNEIIGLTRETNRTPGGLQTIKEVSRLLLLSSTTKLLDIGTSTGHSAMEFARITNCNVTGIDINKMSLDVARQRIEALRLNNVKFCQEDATKMSFTNETFDVVFAGNVISLIDQKNKALEEYWRVLKHNGYLVVVPMYYILNPPEQLVNDVRLAIKVNINVYKKSDWKKFFLTENVEVFEEIDYRFTKCTNDQISNFCKDILNRAHLKTLSPEARTELESRYRYFMNLFNENLSHMGFSILILRRQEDKIFNDPQLYESERLPEVNKLP